ncbi:TrkH family potassium uptake protein [Alkalicoccus halolimnae]|uniref:TrkH family potassium uptake protein n=1 Tax=Alkalicoccus halolimnae TaxID=1667239 RepID=A0A5C7FFV7_9BACI|nr:TrkH family potassium uptake protein [Alkalicoccus halolimnae]TXF81820.1 Ktr system potassium transporter B [Alkalicoccus halolimnae]
MSTLTPFFRRLTPPQFLAVGFAVSIIAGAFLLYLPISTSVPISWIDALFTAASAATVTGLVVVDTETHFTVFGELILMILIKMGGLGLMSLAVLIVLALGKKMGLRERMLVQESFNQPTPGGMIRLAKMLLIFSFSMELAATLILAVRWVPEYGWGYGLFTSLFHAVSAFNNAGFSLWSSSLTAYAGDPLINVVITILFITGGIGFTVVYDAIKTKKFRHLSLHSKMMIIGTLVLNAGAALTVFLLEYGNPATLGALDMQEKLWTSYFQAVTPRTAGFNTIDISALEPSTLTVMMVLMFIGAGSASTGSGIKLTTFLVIILAAYTYLRGRKEPAAFGRRIESNVVTRALAIAVISLILVILSIFVLTITEDAPYLVIVFEAFSAFGTVGLSMGLTYELSTAGKFIIMILMIVGRIGPVTLAFALAKGELSNVRYPKGDVFTG